MTWLGLTGKFGKENIPTPLNMSPTLRLTLRPSLIPQECFRKTPLLQLASDDVKGGDRFGGSVSVFGGSAIVGSGSYNNVKGRAYLYKRVLGAWIN